MLPYLLFASFISSSSSSSSFFLFLVLVSLFSSLHPVISYVLPPPLFYFRPPSFHPLLFRLLLLIYNSPFSFFVLPLLSRFNSQSFPSPTSSSRTVPLVASISSSQTAQYIYPSLHLLYFLTPNSIILIFKLFTSSEGQELFHSMST